MTLLSSCIGKKVRDRKKNSLILKSKFLYKSHMCLVIVTKRWDQMVVLITYMYSQMMIALIY